jgi:hypothetical protein
VDRCLLFFFFPLQSLSLFPGGIELSLGVEKLLGCCGML